MMARNDCLEDYLRGVVKRGRYSNEKNLKFYLEYLFENIPLEGKKVLDIGGGDGIFSFYAACRGAREVVCLEPAASDPDSRVLELFNGLRDEVDPSGKVRLVAETFQDFSADFKFDIILSHNSINHLDEDACTKLSRDMKAIKSYKDIFRKLYSMTGEGSKLIIADCSRYNFFPFFHLKNPFVPNIEWHLHQSPEIWARILCQVGFKNPVIKWTTFNSLGVPGRILFGNRIAAYFLQSHFRLVMER